MIDPLILAMSSLGVMFVLAMIFAGVNAVQAVRYKKFSTKLMRIIRIRDEQLAKVGTIIGETRTGIADVHGMSSVLLKRIDDALDALN